MKVTTNRVLFFGQNVYETKTFPLENKHSGADPLRHEGGDAWFGDGNEGLP